MTTSWEIRLTRPRDRDAIAGIVREAFSDPSRDGHEEVDIVLNSWLLNATVSGLDLVAIEDGEIVGHVLGAYGSLNERRVVGVAPLAVVPHRQSEGIGSGLMNKLLRHAEKIGEPLLLLLGLPAYYGRFGFETAGPVGIDCPCRHRKSAFFDPQAGDLQPSLPGRVHLLLGVGDRPIRGFKEKPVPLTRCSGATFARRHQSLAVPSLACPRMEQRILSRLGVGYHPRPVILETPFFEQGALAAERELRMRVSP